MGNKLNSVTNSGPKKPANCRLTDEQWRNTLAERQENERIISCRARYEVTHFTCMNCRAEVSKEDARWSDCIFHEISFKFKLDTGLLLEDVNFHSADRESANFKVKKVEPGSPADSQGVKPGWFLLKSPVDWTICKKRKAYFVNFCEKLKYVGIYRIQSKVRLCPDHGYSEKGKCFDCGLFWDSPGSLRSALPEKLYDLFVSLGLDIETVMKEILCFADMIPRCYHSKILFPSNIKLYS